MQPAHEGLIPAASPTAPTLSAAAKAALADLSTATSAVYYGFNCRPRQVRYYRVEKASEQVVEALSKAGAPATPPDEVFVGYKRVPRAELVAVAAAWLAKVEAKAAAALARRLACDAEDERLRERWLAASDRTLRDALQAARKASHRKWAAADDTRRILASAAQPVARALGREPHPATAD